MEEKKTSTSTASWATLADLIYKGKSFDVSSMFESWDAKTSLAEKKLTLYPPLVTETEFLLRILIQYQADNWQE